MDTLSQLVGIPFVNKGRDAHGADCWGLLRLALWVAGKIDVPSYDELYGDVHEAKENAELIAGNISSWVEVPVGSEQRLDGVLLREGRYPAHVACVTSPGKMLHTYSGGRSCVDRYRESPFRERVVGFYRHSSLV